MNELITIKDIARICGCGVSTVSRALNNHPDINPDTKKRIMEVVEEYGFVPNNSARNLKITTSNTIAVLVKGANNPFFMKMIGIINDDIQARHYTMELRHVAEKADEVEVAYELTKEKKLQGIIFLGGLSTHSTEKLEQLGVPFVLSTVVMDEDAEGAYSSIAVDDVKESYKLTKYLIDKGHKKIAFIGASETDISIGQMRREGYLKALKEAGIEPDRKLMWLSKDGVDAYTMENGYNIMASKLKKGAKPDFTAVFAIADTIAFGAMRALSDAGIRIPDDVSVVGFDGIDMGAFSIPSLTTIRQPFVKMAHRTTQMLFSVMSEETNHSIITMDAELVERESVKAI